MPRIPSLHVAGVLVACAAVVALKSIGNRDTDVATV